MLSGPNIHMVGLFGLSWDSGPWLIDVAFITSYDIDPVMGKHPLEVSFDRVFPSFGDSHILKADYGGSLLEYLVYFLLAPLVSVGSHIP